MCFSTKKEKLLNFLFSGGLLSYTFINFPCLQSKKQTNKSRVSFSAKDIIWHRQPDLATDADALSKEGIVPFSPPQSLLCLASSIAKNSNSRKKTKWVSLIFAQLQLYWFLQTCFDLVSILCNFQTSASKVCIVCTRALRKRTTQNKLITHLYCVSDVSLIHCFSWEYAAHCMHTLCASSTKPLYIELLKAHHYHCT